MKRKVAFHELPLHVGAKLGPTDWLRIDQQRINLFAEATDDRQWIHLDAAAARKGPFGATIAHGYLTLSLVNRFMPELIEVTGVSMGVNYGCDRVRFPAPVRVNSRLRGLGEILAATSVGEGLQLKTRVTVEMETGDRPACVADTLSRFFPA